MSENAGAISEEEVLKLRFEFFKHMTTVSTASTVAVIAVYGLSEKVLRDAAGAQGWPDWVILSVPGFAILGFFLSLLMSLLGLVYIVEGRPLRRRQMVRLRSMWRSSTATFILGVAISAVTAGLIVAGPHTQIGPVLLSLAGLLIILIYFGIKSSADAAKGAQGLVTSSANGPHTTPPRVLSIDPPDQAPDVPLDIHPTATFSEDMDPATIDPSTFKLLDQVALQQVDGSVAYDGSTRVATFNPAAALQNGRLYAATITAGVRDKASNALAADHTWHFTVTARQEAAERKDAG